MIDPDSLWGYPIGIVGSIVVGFIAYGIFCWFMNGCYIGMDKSS